MQQPQLVQHHVQQPGWQPQLVQQPFQQQQQQQPRLHWAPHGPGAMPQLGPPSAALELPPHLRDVQERGSAMQHFAPHPARPPPLAGRLWSLHGTLCGWGLVAQ